METFFGLPLRPKEEQVRVSDDACANQQAQAIVMQYEGLVKLTSYTMKTLGVVFRDDESSSNSIMGVHCATSAV